MKESFLPPLSLIRGGREREGEEDGGEGRREMKEGEARNI